MGPYWRDGVDRPTPLGAVLAAAKHDQDEDALHELTCLLGTFAVGLTLGPDPLVVAVPPGPDRRAHPVPALAQAVAQRLGAELGDVLRRENVTPRLRDTPEEKRRDVVEAAGYAVNGDVDGRSVVLIDDVVLTGTTLGYLAELLDAAGAREINAVVACRTRRAG